MIKLLHRFFYAWLFLTKLPAPPLPKATKEDWGRIAPYFTLIGFLIGLILFLFAKIFLYFKLPVLFSALLLVFLWVLITGGLHLDGLMDTFDGINCQDKTRKIEAMKDSRIGAFGAMAGIFVVLFKLISLCTIILNKIFFVIIISCALARLAAVYSFTFLNKSKDSGISSSLLLSGVKKPGDFFANLFCFVIVFLMCIFCFHLKFIYLVYGLLSMVFCLLWSHWLDNHFKGHTGDTYGALIELSEVTILCLVVIFKQFLLL
ncbi:MAG: adenosylcobinamide-GDP ribazoletransferase [Candidatus Melainabacteria bacterium]|nr:adenosylcobinamide-GDP ribazoletransferase [Candidatus Melainabacteria bacterium]